MAEHLQQRQLQRALPWQRFLSSRPPAWPRHHLGKRSQRRWPWPDAPVPSRGLKSSSRKVSAGGGILKMEVMEEGGHSAPACKSFLLFFRQQQQQQHTAEWDSWQWSVGAGGIKLRKAAASWPRTVSRKSFLWDDTTAGAKRDTSEIQKTNQSLRLSPKLCLKMDYSCNFIPHKSCEWLTDKT